MHANLFVRVLLVAFRLAECPFMSKSSWNNCFSAEQKLLRMDVAAHYSYSVYFAPLSILPIYPYFASFFKTLGNALVKIQIKTEIYLIFSVKTSILLGIDNVYLPELGDTYFVTNLNINLEEVQTHETFNENYGW